MNKEEFYDCLKKININLSDYQKNQLDEYCNLLLDYNKNVNLTAIKTPEEVYLKHFYDSLTISELTNFDDIHTILDVGSGAGFPGLVLKIVYPHIAVTLLDSNNKKTTFMSFIAQKLGLNNLEIINKRAEDYFKEGKKFDLVVARAVANLNVLTELCLPFVKINGYFIAMKGSNNNEVEEAAYAIKFLGGEKISIKEFELPKTAGKRTLILIKKNTMTPNGYPRSYDKIIKKALKINQK